MAASELDAFLKGDAPEPEPAPVEQPDARPEPEPKADAADGGGAKKPPDAATEADDAEPPEPREGEALVPRRAFEAVRHERQDWKARAIAAETRSAAAETQRAELQRQFEEAKRAPPPAPVQQAAPAEIPNPAYDPAGYHAYIVQELERERQVRAREQINHTLNLSERDAIKEHGKEKVEAMKAEFLEAKNADPTLGERLIQQSDPYGWAMQQIEKIRMQREIGDDPAAYRAKMRAEFEAEMAAGQQPARVSPAAGMAPSLASVRSVAGRSAPAFSGPPSLDDIVASIHRK